MTTTKNSPADAAAITWPNLHADVDLDQTIKEAESANAFTAKYAFRLSAVRQAVSTAVERRPTNVRWSMDPDCPFLYVESEDSHVLVSIENDETQEEDSNSLPGPDPMVFLDEVSLRDDQNPESPEVASGQRARSVFQDVGAYNRFFAALKDIVQEAPDAMREHRRGQNDVTEPVAKPLAEPGDESRDESKIFPMMQDRLVGNALVSAMGVPDEQVKMTRTRDPIEYRRYRMVVKNSNLPGWVTFWDTGNCWCLIENVELPPHLAKRFLSDLRQLMADNPRDVEQPR